MSETLEADSNSESVPEETTPNRRRRFRPDEINIANRFIALAEVGTPIEFSSLDIELKRAVLPNRRARLIDRGVLDVDYDEDTGLLKTVTVNAEGLKDYEWDLKPIPEAKVSFKTTLKGEPRQRKPRSILADPKYLIHLGSETNPKRPGTHAWFNWKDCYQEGQSIPDYLSKMNYPRMSVTNKGTYFNGPSTLFIEQDLKAGHIGIYDSSLPLQLDNGEPNLAIWVKFEDLNRIMAEPDDEEDSAESAEVESVEENREPVAV